MLKKIAIAGMGVLVGCTSFAIPALAEEEVVIEKNIEKSSIDKRLADKEIVVYKDKEFTETAGKLFEDNIADIISEDGDIVEIESGELHGFVKAEGLKDNSKEEILDEDIKGVVKETIDATPVKSETKELVKSYSVKKEDEKVKEGEEYSVKTYGDTVIIEKDGDLVSIDPEKIDIDYQRAEGKTDEVLAAEKKEADDTAAANAVLELFDALADDVGLSDKDSIEYARQAYNNLTEDQKKKIDRLNLLEEAEDELEVKIKEEEERIAKEEAERKAREAEEEALRIAQEQAEQEEVADREANAIANADYYNQIAQSKVSYNVDATGWDEGVASAYGGYSDASVAANARTATGAPCTETSMGVAVPMAWPNYRSLFGHTVLISWGGKTVTATINDCGGMGNGSRSLDLQPGVFRAFGFTNCYDWGLKTVKYKIL